MHSVAGTRRQKRQSSTPDLCVYILYPHRSQFVFMRRRGSSLANPRPSIYFKALTVVCTDRWRSDRFYTEVLGAINISREITCQWYRLGDLTFTLVPNAYKNNPADFRQDALNMLYLDVDDLELAQRHFEKYKVSVCSLPMAK
jgi:hypothetical protein